MKMYQVHKVVDYGTGEHKPIQIFRGKTGEVEPAVMNEESTRHCYAIGLEHGARPIYEHPDGRMMLGDFVYVPQNDDGEIPSTVGNRTTVTCPDCESLLLPTTELRYPVHYTSDGLRCDKANSRIGDGEWT